MDATPGTMTGKPLIESDRVEGTTVYGSNGENIGSIKRLMIEKLSGRVAYAVMSFGGFLGIGEKYHPLPWHVLNYDQAQGAYVIDLNKERLATAPAYALTDPIRWEDNEWRTRLDDFYRKPVAAAGANNASAVPAAPTP